MPRLIGNKYYTAAPSTDFTEYLTPTTSQQQQQQQQHNYQLPSVSSQQTICHQQKNRNSKSRSHSPSAALVMQDTATTSTNPRDNIEICSEEEQQQRQEVMSNMISDDLEDFEGFDNDIASDISCHHANAAVGAADAAVSQLYQDSNRVIQNLKRHSPFRAREYLEDSEGVVEAIEVEDDEIEIIDGQLMYRSHCEKTPVKSKLDNQQLSLLQTYNNPQTPNKRKKHESNISHSGDAVSPPKLLTPPDQIVEISSDSATQSLQEKRQKINSKFNSKLPLAKHCNININNTNKCSTESTSEFPISSPSNPQQQQEQPTRKCAGKYSARPPLLKNTLGGDSFECQLATITATNPQMSLKEKIEGWQCEDVVSEIEDVVEFESKFRKYEDSRKLEVKQCKAKNKEIKCYDYAMFKHKILNIMNIPYAKRFLAASGSGSGGTGCAAGHVNKQFESSESESSKSPKNTDERPSTSAVAQQHQLQQRRCKPTTTLNAETLEKKRLLKQQQDLKRQQNSTTPPHTSSSDNERDCFKNFNKPLAHCSNKQPANDSKHDKTLCPSSSEEANSQDMPNMLMIVKHTKQQTLNVTAAASASTATLTTITSNKQMPTTANQNNDSVFRLHRLNREIDKAGDIENTNSPSFIDQTKRGLIKIRLDFDQDEKNQKQIKSELFKTPIIPEKYAQNQLNTEDVSDIFSCATAADAGANSKSQQLSDNQVSTTNKVEQMSESAGDHEQYEFCNYLGLTGMATAAAMANAVAELAECKLARRSMRVLRQQHQERRSKEKEGNAKEINLVQSSPNKDRREQKEKHCRAATKHLLLKSDDGSQSQSIETITTTTTNQQQIRKQDSNSSSTATKSTKSQISVKLNEKNDAEIKIVCHLATDSKTVETNTKPAASLSTQINDVALQPSDHKEGVAKSCTPSKDNISVSPLSALNSKQDQDTLIINSGKLQQLPISNKRVLRSPKMSELKALRNKTHFFKKIEQQLQETELFLKEAKTSFNNLETTRLEGGAELPATKSCSVNIETAERSPLLASPQGNLQAAFKESLKAKPSIFIVQSLDNLTSSPTADVQRPEQPATKEASIKSVTTRLKQTALAKFVKNKKQNQLTSSTPTVESSGSHEIETRSKKITNKFLRPQKRPSKKLPKRQLRKRTLVILRSSKRTKEIILPPKTTSGKSLNKKAITKIRSSSSATNNRPVTSSISVKEPRKNALATPSPAPTKSFRNAQTETEDLYIASSNSGIETSSPKRKTRLMGKTSQLLSRRMTLRNRASNFKAKLSAKIKKTKLKLKPAKFKKLTNPNDEQQQNKETDTIYKEISTSSLAIPFREPISNANLSTTAADHKMPLLLHPKINNSLRISNSTQQQQQATSLEFKTLYINTPSSSSTLVEAITSTPPPAPVLSTPPVTPHNQQNLQDNDTVVVSSTTNTFYDEALDKNRDFDAAGVAGPTAAHTQSLETKDTATQTYHKSINNNISIVSFENKVGSNALLKNPLLSNNGNVLYLYYELDILICIQEKLISFWKCSKLVNLLTNSRVVEQNNTVNSATGYISAASLCRHQSTNNVILQSGQNDVNNSTATPANATSSPSTERPTSDCQNAAEWCLLGELKRLVFDHEIPTPYDNRICTHNSIPIYVEMRARQLAKNQRDCNLLSMYINIYYYHDEEMLPKSCSIALDTIQSDVKDVNFTTLIDSRYFIMTWPQQNILGKNRSGLCKYSLTPQLDTLASIREFKSMKYTIKYLECMKDDKLIGFGDSQITIWDHRSGDVLMNYDLEIPLGKNLGSIYYPSQDIEQNNMLLLFQYRDFHEQGVPAELLCLLCTISHNQPAYRIVKQIALPYPSFKFIHNAINTGEHLIIQAAAPDQQESATVNEELWINCMNPGSIMNLVTKSSQQPNAGENKRFYMRDSTQLIELNEKTLNINTLANYLLQVATTINVDP